MTRVSDCYNIKLLHLNHTRTQNRLEFSTQFRRIMHGIIAGCESSLPLAVRDHNLIMIAAWSFGEITIDFLHFHHIIGDSKITVTTALQHEPDEIAFTIHLLCNGLDRSDFVTENTRPDT